MEQSVLRDNAKGPVMEGAWVGNYSGSSAGPAQGIQNMQAVDSGRTTHRASHLTRARPKALTAFQASAHAT
jgi:hypothetical protein